MNTCNEGTCAEKEEVQYKPQLWMPHFVHHLETRIVEDHQFFDSIPHFACMDAGCPIAMETMVAGFQPPPV